MAIIVVGSIAPVKTTGAATVAWPSGHLVDDYALLIVASRDGQSITTPSGWTQLFTPISKTDAGAGTGNGTTQSVYYKFATSSSESSVTLNDPGTYTIASMVVYRNVNTTTPLAAGPTSSECASTTGTTPAGITGHTATGTAPFFNVLVVSRGEQGTGGAWDSGNTVSDLGASGAATIVQEGSFDGGIYEGCLVIAHDSSVTSGVLYTPSVVFNGTGNRSCTVTTMVTLQGVEASFISGDSQTALTTSGTLSGSGALVGDAAASLSTTGSLSAQIAISGDVTMISSASGTLTGTGELVGSTSMVLVAEGTGQVLSESLLSASVSLGLAASGTLAGTGTLAGSASNTLSTLGTLTGAGALVSADASVLIASGTLSQTNGMAGSVSMGLTITSAVLSGTYNLGGNAFGTLTTTGVLTGIGYMSGSSSSVLAAGATGSQSTFIKGSSSSVLTTMATLRALTSPSIALNWRNKWLAVYNTRQTLLNKISGITKLTLDSQSTSITSLQNSINHPTTGLAALSTAQTTLSSRVSVNEGQISVQSANITSLTASVAGKADVSITNSLTARIDNVDSPYGYNLLNNPGLAVDMRNWGTIFWNQASDPNWIVERNLLGVGYQVAGFSNFGFRNTATPATGVNFVAGSDYIPAVAGYEYIASGKIAAAGFAVADLRIYFFNDAFGLVGEAFATPDATGYAGGTSENNWVLSYVKIAAPATATWMRIGLRGLTNGTATPRAQLMKAMIERAAPGQTVPSTWNTGRLAAWAEWDLQFNVNGYISGIRLANNGKTSDFTIDADTFKVLKPGGGAALTWENGTLWNKGATYSVIIGQDIGIDSDLLIYAGPNPASTAVADKANAAFWVDEDGNAGFSGTVKQSLLYGSAFELGSTHIHTGGGRLAPFVIRDHAFVNGGLLYANRTVTVSDFISPHVGAGFDWKRFSQLRMDVYIEALAACDTPNNNQEETVILEVQYDGGAWQEVTTVTAAAAYKAFIPVVMRYTTADSWTNCAFRARTTQGHTIALSLKVEVLNFNTTGNTAGTNSGLGGGGSGSPPSGGGGGGGGGEFECVDYDSLLSDGRLVRDLQVGDLVECIDIASGMRSMEPLLAMNFGDAYCYLVKTTHGAVIQSESTPMDMPDGRIVRTPNLEGELIMTHAHGYELASIRPLGVRKVCKPDFGNRMFFAGMSAGSTIATHNAVNKTP